ncbi:MAG: ABC transporter permease [Ferruginibacter sp.]
MIKNYFKTAWRNLRQNKLLSFVNIAGLAIGLACVMLILLFVNDEYSYDRFHTKGDRLVRLVQTDTDTAGNERRSGNTGNPQGPAFFANIPEVENFCRVKGWPMLSKKGNEAIESMVLFADTSIFSMFSFNVLKGNPANMLLARNSVVITDEAAKKYFGNSDPLGKTIDLEVEEDFEPFTVTGVLQKPPMNSSIRFDLLLSFERQLPADPTERAESLGDWYSLFLNTFLLLKENADPKIAEAKLFPVFLKNSGEDWNKTKAEAGLSSRSYKLQPFLSMHLDSEFYASNGLSNWSDSKYSYILSGLAVLILIIACINFINIMLAKSLQRSKEIGVRRVSGSSSGQLIMQFLSESLLVTLVSFVPAFFIMKLLLPVFGRFTNRLYDSTYLFQPKVLILYASLLMLVSLLAGFYPALVAAKFKPVQTLYGKVKLSGKNILGKSLVVMQFVIAVTLIICTIVFNRQFSFMTMGDLGFKKENILHMELPWGKASEKLQLFRRELAKSPAIENVGGKNGGWNSTFFFVNGKKTDWVGTEEMDDQYLKIIDVPLVQGRYLSYNNVADTVSNLLVNETFVETYLDKSKDPLGQTVGRKRNDAMQEYNIVGVVKDYHDANFKQKIKPMCFYLDKRGRAFNSFIKFMPGQSKEAIAAITKTYKTIFPFSTMEYQMLQDWNESWYTEEARWKEIVSYAAIIAIMLSCMGLFALSTLSIQQRVKEIGIRKVLGAGIANITSLVSKDFMKLVLIALIIASPLAWWIMNKWLQDFVYRISISWWMFALAGFLALLTAFATVAYHAFKASLANPVKSLRTE